MTHQQRLNRIPKCAEWLKKIVHTMAGSVDRPPCPSPPAGVMPPVGVPPPVRVK